MFSLKWTVAVDCEGILQSLQLVDQIKNAVQAPEIGRGQLIPYMQLWQSFQSFFKSPWVILGSFNSTCTPNMQMLPWKRSPLPSRPSVRNELRANPRERRTKPCLCCHDPTPSSDTPAPWFSSSSPIWPPPHHRRKRPHLPLSSWQHFLFKSLTYFSPSYFLLTFYRERICSITFSQLFEFQSTINWFILVSFNRSFWHTIPHSGIQSPTVNRFWHAITQVSS